jgi:hypothetical protein
MLAPAPEAAEGVTKGQSFGGSGIQSIKKAPQPAARLFKWNWPD